MNDDTHQQPSGSLLLQRGSSAHAVTALLAVAIAAGALLGWLLQQPGLTSWWPGRPSMSPMTAALVVLSAAGAVAFPHRQRLSARLGLLQVLASTAILLAHLLGLPNALHWPAVWWYSPFTAGVFLASGVATTLMAIHHLAHGQVAALAVLLFTVLLGLGHVFPQGELYRYVPGTGVAVPTVVAFLLLSLCQILACRHHGVVGALASGRLAGHVGLLLLCAGCAAILLISAVVLAARHARGFDADTAVLLVAWSAIAVLVGTLWALAVAVDRTDAGRLAAERERDQMRQLVAAAVTHDLRSPLLAATMSTVLLRRLVAEPAAVAAIGRLERSHRRMDRLLRTLMDALAAEGGRAVVLRPTACLLADIVHEVVQEHEALLAGRVKLQGNAEGWWDRDALMRVVENLLLNAHKYGADGTPIDCEVARLPDGQVSLTISNHGAPIPQAEWDTIFQPFARGRQTEQLQTGWGVGLAFARSVATAHGGSIGVARSDESGTTFMLRLPQDARPAASPSA